MGRRSVTFHLTFRATDRTLEAPEVGRAEARLLGVLERELGVHRRDQGAPAPEDARVLSYERPDLRAVEDLERLLRNLAEEVAGWRRRTLKAEAELQEMRSLGGATPGPSWARRASGSSSWRPRTPCCASGWIRRASG